MAQQRIGFLWWGPVVILLSVALIHYLLLRPIKIQFLFGKKVMRVSYRFGGLLKKERTYPFDELESVRSHFRIAGDNDPEVSLEITLKNHARIPLMSAVPEWAPLAPLLGYSGCIEPKHFEALRQEIAALTGVNDLGFVR